MIYRVRHETRYNYDNPVSVSHHIVRLTPRSTASQKLIGNWIIVNPRPSVTRDHNDYFSNKVTSFNLLEPHEVMAVEAISEIIVHAPAPVDLADSQPWEIVRDSRDTDIESCQFAFDSPRAAAVPKLADYAWESFTPGRPILEAARDLTSRIHSDFRFDSEATEVSTPVETFWEKRRGVCQDFSHLEIACLRSIGLPARYVSGYLRTEPPPGQPRLVGADASHAWCSVWAPSHGWVDFDPTNNTIPSTGHITLAWGRDYGDVSPVYGVLLGGEEHTVDVAVDVMPLEDPQDLTAAPNA